MKLFKLSALVGIISACIMFVAGCSPSDEEIVSERALRFTKQLFAGDVTGLEEIAVPESIAAAKSLADMIPDVAKERNKTSGVYSVLEGTVDNDRAIVKVLVVRPGEKDVVATIPLAKQDGEWKVVWTKTNGGIE